MKPYHNNDCDDCKYLGSDDKTEMDYYYCPQGSIYTVLVRFGDEDKYLSGLHFYGRDYHITRAANLALLSEHITVIDILDAGGMLAPIFMGRQA